MPGKHSLTTYVRRNLKIMAMNLINVCQQVAAIHLVESFDAACQIPPEYNSAGRYCTISVKVVVRVRVPVEDVAEAETVTFDEPAGVPGSPPPLPELEPPPQLTIGIMQIAIARAANADQRPFCGVELKIIATAKASADANHNRCP